MKNSTVSVRNNFEEERLMLFIKMVSKDVKKMVCSPFLKMESEYHHLLQLISPHLSVQRRRRNHSSTIK